MQNIPINLCKCRCEPWPTRWSAYYRPLNILDARASLHPFTWEGKRRVFVAWDEHPLFQVGLFRNN